jgi:hypothetical protein
MWRIVRYFVFLQPQPVLLQEDDSTASGDSNRQEEKLKLRAILHTQKIGQRSSFATQQNPNREEVH